MPADAPTILASSGGYVPGRRTELAFGPIVQHAVERSGASGRPRVCHVGTAAGDQRWFSGRLAEAARVAGFELSELTLFTQPNVEDLRGFLLEQDVVWVGGGSVVNLLAVWRAHGLDEIFREVWQSGVVLAGISAGSICWHQGGTTDSFGDELRAVTNGLGLVPFGNGVHHDSEPQRRPLVKKLVAEGLWERAYCTDDGVGLVYEGTELVEAVTELRGKGAYVVLPEGGSAVEERIEPRELPGAR